jgi:integrase
MKRNKDTLTLEGLALAIKSWGKLHLRANTLDGYTYSLQHAISFFGAEKQICSIKPIQVIAFQQNRLESVSTSTVNSNIRDLRSVVNRAIKLKVYAGPNPFESIDRLKVPAHLPKWLTIEQVDTLISFALADGRNAHLIFGLGIFAGLRKAEIDACTWSWIDFDLGFITVKSDVDGAGKRFITKNHRSRTIPLHDRLLSILSEYRQDEGYLIQPEKTDYSKNRYRFDIRRTFSRVALAANMDITPHIMRHTFASLLAQSGKVSLLEIASLLGHADTKTTEIYAHLCPTQIDVNVF